MSRRYSKPKTENFYKKDFEFCIEALRKRKLPTIHIVDDSMCFTIQRNGKGRRLEWELHYENGGPIEVDLDQVTYPADPLSYLPLVKNANFVWFLTLISRINNVYKDNSIARVDFDPESVDYKRLPKNKERRELSKLVIEHIGNEEGPIKRLSFPDLPNILIEKMIELWAADGFG